MKNLLLSIAVGFFGHLNAQTDFVKLNSPTSNRLFSIDFADDQYGFIGGEDATLIKTMDGGKSWTSVNINTAPWVFSKMDIVQLQFLTKDSGFAVVGNFKQRNTNSYLWRTSNGGINWEGIRINVNMVPWRINATGFDTGLIGGSAYFQGSVISNLSGDSVVNLTSFSWDGANYIESLARHQINPNFIMAVTNASSIHRSFDGGTTWDTINSGFNRKIHSIINSGSNWVVTIDSSHSIWYTPDSGQTWKLQTTTFLYPNFQSVALSNTDSLVYAGIVGNGGEIGYSKKGLQYYYQPTPMKLRNVACNPNGDTFVVGDSGAIYRRDTKLTGLINVKHNKLITVYPNPTKGLLYLDDNTSGSVNVYDINGQIVKSGFIKNNSFDISNLHFGQYLVIIKDVQTLQEYTVKVLKE